MAQGMLDVDVVAADRRVWQGQAVSVIARTIEGDLGILPQHEPILAVLVPCAVEILTNDGKREIIAVDGGFLSVDNNRVAVLSQFARLAREISLPDAEHELADAERRLEAGQVDIATHQHERRARAQIRAAQRYQQLH